MAASTTQTITNLQEKVIGPARMTLKDDVLAIKSSYNVERGRPGMDDTFNSPKVPGVTAFGLSEGVDMVSETLIDSNVPVSATEVGVSVRMTKKMLRTVQRDKFLRDAGKAMGSAVNVKQEQDYATLIDGYSNVVGVDGASSTIGQLSAGLSQLASSVEPINEVMMREVSAVISPFMWHDIRQQLFPAGSGTSHAPDTAQNNTANTRTLSKFHPQGEYFGTPIKISTNLVSSGTDVRGGIFHKNAGLIYEFMPVALETDDSDKSRRDIELVMVIDYGFAEILDIHGREWRSDNTAPTS
jgi:hypothetical protein